MLNDGETVDCQISDAAMDELAGVRARQARRERAVPRASRRIEELRPGCSTTPGREGRRRADFLQHIPQTGAPGHPFLAMTVDRLALLA